MFSEKFAKQNFGIMNQQVIVLNSDEFFEKNEKLIKETIQTAFNSSYISSPNEILRQEDVCNLLKKSKQTIINWTNQGVLKPHYINGSVFYFYSEIIEILKKEK